MIPLFPEKQWNSGKTAGSQFGCRYTRHTPPGNGMLDHCRVIDISHHGCIRRMILGYAQRMGVTIYTIGVSIPSTKIATRWQINKLASATGGKAYFVSEKSGLDRIYDEINRELRTQYLLAYTSSSEKPPDELRKIKVEVDRKGVKVRTLAGYYPTTG
jgi:VWFA-related protein